MDKNISIEEQIEHISRITNHLRKEHFARGVAVREALQEEIALIHKTRQAQHGQMADLEKLKNDVRSRAEALGRLSDKILSSQNSIFMANKIFNRIFFIKILNFLPNFSQPGFR